MLWFGHLISARLRTDPWATWARRREMPAWIICLVLALAGSLDAQDRAGDGVNPAVSALAAELLEQYDGDLARLELVAANADYAALAWAAYAEPAALDYVAKRGWTIVELVKNPNLIAGDTKATLFRSDTGQHVLAFRGTAVGGDWVTNSVGTILPAGLIDAQILGAIEVSSAVALEHPEVTFTGHSLGGRLATIGLLVTNRPAVVFNSAPLGRLEMLSLVRLHDTFRLSQDRAPRTGFRSPADQLTSVFPAGDLEVSNVVLPEEWTALERLNPVALLEALRQLRFNHAAQSLAQSMFTVKLVHDQGGFAPTKEDTSFRDHVFSASDVLRREADESLYCMLEDAGTACLEDLPFWPRIRDSVLLLTEYLPPPQGNPPETPALISFQEFGEVDFGSFQPYPFHESGSVFLNGAFQVQKLTYSTDPLRQSQDIGDAKNILRTNPRAFTGLVDVTGYNENHAEGNYQVFHLTHLLQDDCMVCPPIGSITMRWTFLDGKPAQDVEPIVVAISTIPPARFDKERDVRTSLLAVQRALTHAGYDPGPMDGRPHASMDVALVAFKRDRCLDPNPTLDEATFEHLDDPTHYAPSCLERIRNPSFETLDSAGIRHVVGETPELVRLVSGIMDMDCVTHCLLEASGRRYVAYGVTLTDDMLQTAFRAQAFAIGAGTEIGTPYLIDQGAFSDYVGQEAIAIAFDGCGPAPDGCAGALFLSDPIKRKAMLVDVLVPAPQPSPPPERLSEEVTSPETPESCGAIADATLRVACYDRFFARPKTLEDCATIADATARLGCFDSVSGLSTSPPPTPLVPAVESVPPFSDADRRQLAALLKTQRQTAIVSGCRIGITAIQGFYRVERGTFAEEGGWAGWLGGGNGVDRPGVKKIPAGERVRTYRIIAGRLDETQLSDDGNGGLRIVTDYGGEILHSYRTDYYEKADELHFVNRPERAVVVETRSQYDTPRAADLLRRLDADCAS